jgi:hypothetical protein
VNDLSYKTRDELVSSFKGLVSQYPGLVSYERIGYSTQNREILCFKIGPHWGGKVLWQSCIHGREIINGEILWLYANWLLQRKEPDAERILRHNLTMIIPILNVDNYNVTRKNANGVDLNRNFKNGWCGGSTDPTRYDYKGPSPLSEKESQALNAFLQRERPIFFVDMHTGEPYNIYGASASAYGKPPQYDAEMLNAINLYKQICSERGQNPSEYTIKSLGPYGRAMCDAVYYGAHGFLWEFHEKEHTVPDGPPYSEVEPIWFPKFLPMAIALSRQCEVTQSPSPIPLLMILAGLYFLLQKGK